MVENSWCEASGRGKKVLSLIESVSEAKIIGRSGKNLEIQQKTPDTDLISAVCRLLMLPPSADWSRSSPAMSPCSPGQGASTIRHELSGMADERMATTAAETIAMGAVPMWIGERWDQADGSGRFGLVSNPSTGQPIARVPLGTADDAGRAVAAAAEALPAWAEIPAVERARVLFRFPERLISLRYLARPI